MPCFLLASYHSSSDLFGPYSVLLELCLSLVQYWLSIGVVLPFFCLTRNPFEVQYGISIRFSIGLVLIDPNLAKL